MTDKHSQKKVLTTAVDTSDDELVENEPAHKKTAAKRGRKRAIEQITPDVDEADEASHNVGKRGRKELSALYEEYENMPKNKRTEYVYKVLSKRFNNAINALDVNRLLPTGFVLPRPISLIDFEERCMKMPSCLNNPHEMALDKKK